MDSVLNVDVVCWATPIYYYEMSGQMKTLIDRMNAMYPKDYRFRDIYLLTTAAEDEESTPKLNQGKSFALSRWRALVTEDGEIPSRTACSDTENCRCERI